MVPRANPFFNEIQNIYATWLNMYHYFGLVKNILICTSEACYVEGVLETFRILILHGLTYKSYLPLLKLTHVECMLKEMYWQTKEDRQANK